MFFIPGRLIAALTFPGVIIHEMAHMFFCKLNGIPVLDVCFFQFENPSGYVIHEEAKKFNASFWVSVGPFFINSLLCIVICFPAYLPIEYFGVDNTLSYFLLWLGISIGMHAFPSTQDAKNLLVYAKKEVSTFNLLAMISFPLVLLIYIANLLSIFWFDYLYGFAIGIGLPSLLF